jgi:hypothetical protein
MESEKCTAMNTCRGVEVNLPQSRDELTQQRLPLGFFFFLFFFGSITVRLGDFQYTCALCIRVYWHNLVVVIGLPIG